MKKDKLYHMLVGLIIGFIIAFWRPGEAFFAAAVVCLFSAYLWVIIYGNHGIALFGVFASFFVHVVSNKKVFWIEVIAFMMIYASLIYP